MKKKIGDKIYLTRDKNEFKLEIDQRANSLKLILIIFWFVLVFIAGMMLIPEYLILPNEWTFDKIFYSVILIAWVFFLFKIGKLLAWRYLGREEIKIVDGKLSVKNLFGSVGKPQLFTLKDIHKFKEYPRPNDLLKKYIDYEFLTIGGERFEFSYKNKEYIFGKMLSENEVRIVLPILRKELNRKG